MPTYAVPKWAQQIDEEIEAAQSLGLPVSLADLSGQKFLAESAICMKGQARSILENTCFI
jgi:hypothetical protein